MAVTNNTQKYWMMKVYNPTTNAYVDTFHSKEFKDNLEFSIEINNGVSPMELETNLTLGDWTQTTGRFSKLDIGQKVKFWVFDKENPAGIQVYSGIFNGIRLRMENDQQSFVLTFLPNTFLLYKKVLRDSAGSNTTVSYNSVEPADMVKSIVFRAGVGIGYNDSTVRNTGLSRTYQFVSSNSMDALKKVMDLLPRGWFFYIGGDDKIYLRNHEMGDPEFTLWGQFNWGTGFWEFDPSTQRTREHRIAAMTQCAWVEFRKDMSDMTNQILFLGGGSPQLYKQYSSTSSQSVYGTYEELLSDERVTNANTSEYMSERVINEKMLPKTYATAEIIDSNFSSKGYDIETIRPGDKIRIDSVYKDELFTKWGQFNWGENKWRYSIKALFGSSYYIKKVTYRLYSVIVEMDLYPEGFGSRVSDAYRDLRSYRFKDAPSVPDNI